MQNALPYLKTFGLSFMSMSCMLSLTMIPATLASDHVDSPSVTVTAPVFTPGQVSAKPPAVSGKPEDITDVYAFREQDQSGNAADAGKICLVLTLNGLIPQGQWRPFSPDVSYQFKVATDKANLATTSTTITFRFGNPDLNTGTQQIFMNGSTTAIGSTTAFNQAAVSNTATLNTQAIKVFAGEMDDPFFLDFRVLTEGLPFGVSSPFKYDLTKYNANVAGSLPYDPTGNPNTNRQPGDTFGVSNVNAIVVSVPTAAFTATANPTLFVWGVTAK